MKNKRTKVRVTALFMLVVLLFVSVPMEGIVSFAAETKNKVIVYVAVEGKNASGTTVTIDKPPVVLDTGSMASDAIKQVLSNSSYKDNYVISETSWGLSLDSIGGLATESVGNDWYYWNFCVNGTPASVGIGAYQLQDQDKISLIYSYNNQNVSADAYSDDITKNPNPDKTSELLNVAIKNRNTLAAVIYRDVFGNGAKIPSLGQNTNDFYTVYSLKQAGFEAAEFYDAVYSKLEKELTTLESGKSLSDGTTKESILASGYASPYYAKLALVVTAMGHDATNVAGINLIEKLVNKDIFNASANAATYGTYGREGMILMAIDEGNYRLPVGDGYLTRADLVNAQVADVMNAVETSIQWGTMDNAAMAIQSLAPYVNTAVEGVDQEAVKKATTQALKYMECMQGKDGSVGNCWTLAQVMYAAGKFNINILSENSADFIKNGVTLYDSADAYVDAEQCTVDNSLMSYQPEQLLRGYSLTIQASIADGVKYTEMVSGAAIAIDMKDVKLETIGSQIYTGKVCKPEVKATYQGISLNLNKQYKLSYKSNKKLGTATVTLQGVGNYQGTITQKFKIVLGNTKITSVKKSGKITFSKVAGAKKYNVQISTDKKFKKNVYKKTVTKPTLTYSFKKGKMYYVRIRAVNGTNKGTYSSIKKIKK